MRMVLELERMEAQKRKTLLEDSGAGLKKQQTTGVGTNMLRKLSTRMSLNAGGGGASKEYVSRRERAQQKNLEVLVGIEFMDKQINRIAQQEYAKLSSDSKYAE